LNTAKAAPAAVPAGAGHRRRTCGRRSISALPTRGRRSSGQ